MQIQNLLILIVSSITVISLWTVKYLFPTSIFQSKYVLYGSTISIVLLSVITYWILNKINNTCSPNDPGVCHSSADCNNNGVCAKNNGKCMCVCNDGYTGEHCEVRSIPWNSQHCMGPNKQWPARKDKNGMCVCPPGNWADGVDKTYGYVKCLTCAGNYGPLAGNAPCMNMWQTANYLTNDCYRDNSYLSDIGAGTNIHPFLKNTDEVCNEFKYLTHYVGPNGEKGYATPIELCKSSFCRCNSSKANEYNRSVCQVTGYLDSTPSQTCKDANIERKCSSYNCY